jgi:energy-converting hydrogenase B subunit D
MIIALLLLLIFLAFYALISRDLLHGVIALSAISLISALLFYLLHAPDVAITEAAVGAGVSTVAFVWAIRATERRDKGTVLRKKGLSVDNADAVTVEPNPSSEQSYQEGD